MRSALRLFFSGWILAIFGAAFASAQSFDFNLFVTSGGRSGSIQNNTTITLTSAVGTPLTVTITATYTGNTQATVATPQYFGSTEIKPIYPMGTTFPLVLNPGQQLVFQVTFTPTDALGATGQVTIPYTETGPTGTTITNSIILPFQGSSPSFSLFYILTTDNNEIALASGGTIPFPATPINTTATAALVIQNVGSGTGQITGIALVSGGPVFKLSGVPSASVAQPISVAGQGGTLNIDVLYTPTAVETDMGQILITYAGGGSATITLTGNGAAASYSYSYVSSGTTSTTVSPQGSITLPSVPLATVGATQSTSSVIVTVKNTGNTSGTINSIGATPPFQVSGLPVTPPALMPGGTESFTITYTPTQVGPQTGTLVVGSDTFKLVSTGIGPNLTFSYTSNGTTISTGTTGVVFPSIAVSKSENVTFTVTNSGTSPTTITLVTASPDPPFSVPTLAPISLAGGKSTSFPITFAPITTGPVTGSLLVNGTGVTLFGGGTTPPALPSYTINGPSGNVQPASQENIGLTLDSSYPSDLDGVLTLTTSGNLGSDPAVQFSTGSSAGNRTVDFFIPAGSTSANFSGQGSQILLQTGTIAETVTLTPTFTTTAGVSVTPANPATLQFSIPSSAPVLENVSIADEAASSFTLVLVGYSTTRSLGSLNVTFNPAPGYNLAVSSFTEDLSGPAAVWFQSADSQSFGGQFQISIPFNLSGTVAVNKTLIQTIASVSATVSNGVGTSGSLEAVLQ